MARYLRTFKKTKNKDREQSGMNNLKIHSASIELREREAMASSSFPADSSLIQRLLLHDVVDGDGDGDDIFLAFLLPWISGTSSTHLQVFFFEFV